MRIMLLYFFFLDDQISSDETVKNGTTSHKLITEGTNMDEMDVSPTSTTHSESR